MRAHICMAKYTLSLNPWMRACIITCQARKDILAKTLESYHAADFTAPPVVINDVGHNVDPKASQMGNSFYAITTMLKLPWEWLLFAEDDVEFNQHIEHNLKTWDLVQNNKMQFARLYGADNVGLVPDCTQIGGSQGLFFLRSAALKIVANWHNFPGSYMQDLRMFQTIKEIYTHQPNLIQHRAAASTWGGLPHTSPTYAAAWRRE